MYASIVDITNLVLDMLGGSPMQNSDEPKRRSTMNKCPKCFLSCFICVLLCVVFAVPSISWGSCSEEKIVLGYSYLGACGYTQSTSFTLAEENYITRIRIWYDTSVGGNPLTGVNTISATLSGPNGYSSASGIITKGGCQGSWCEAIWNLNQALKAGTYTLTAGSKSVCSNPSGQTTLILYGCAITTPTPTPTPTPKPTPTPTPTPKPTPTPTPTGCTAIIDENLFLKIPYLSYINPMLGTMSLWADFAYEFNPTLILFELTKYGTIGNPSFSCVASTLSGDLKIHIPDVLLPDGITHLWVDLEYSTALSTNDKATFVVTNFGTVSDFRYGIPRTYNVSSTTDISIQDTLSGNTFRLPQGGNGTLTITPITSAPENGPAAGIAYKVEYSGAGPLQILIPYNTGEVPLLWLWGEPAVSIDELNTMLESSDESNAIPEIWMPLPRADKTSNPAAFDISVANSTIKLQSPKFWQAKLDKNDGVFDRLGKLCYLASQDIQKIVDKLPANIQQNAVLEINGRLHAYLDGFYELYSSKSLYHPFSYITGNADPYFIFVATKLGGGVLADESTVAHEVGHYMSHVLLGDDRMRNLEAQAIREHGKGDAHANRPMLEEFAYFSDYCIVYEPNGKGGSIEDFAATYGSGRTPKTVDWPSLEGYATSLLSKMHTQNAQQNSIIDPNTTELIPLIQAPLSDLWGILAEGPMSVTALREKIEAYLGDAKKDKLAPLLESSGWSYNGSGRIVDLNNQKIPFAMVQALAKVPSEEKKEYLLPLAPVKADKDGIFTLDRIFPGSNYIRVWPSEGAKQFLDLSLRPVDPSNPTNVDLILGDIIYNLSPVIKSTKPSSGKVGDTITIIGTGFGANQLKSTVTFNGIAASASSWFDTSIVVTVPDGDTTGNVVVTVNGVASNGMLFCNESTDFCDCSQCNCSVAVQNPECAILECCD